MRKALICGYFGFNNFGDELLLHLIIRDLEKIGIVNLDITAISNTPQETSRFHLISAINRWNPFELLTELASTDMLFFLGGLFQDKTSIKSFFYYYTILLIALLFQKKVIFYGAGIGPFKSQISKSLFDSAIKQVKLITIRDNAAGYFAPYNEHIMKSIDPAWTATPDFSVREKISTINWEKTILGISMKSDKYMTPKHLEFFGEKIAKTLQNNSDWQVLFLPCMPQEDIQVNFSLYDFLVNKFGSNRIFIIDDLTKFSMGEQIALFASCDVMFGMRYHGLLIPLANGKPVLGIVCDPKVKALCKEASQVNFTLQDNLEEPWDYFWQSIEHSTEKAIEAKEKAIELHAKNFELLMKLDSL